MKQIIALAIFVCASYGAQAQNKAKSPKNETRTGQVAPAPTYTPTNENRTGQVEIYKPRPELFPATKPKAKKQ